MTSLLDCRCHCGAQLALICQRVVVGRGRHALDFLMLAKVQRTTAFRAKFGHAHVALTDFLALTAFAVACCLSSRLRPKHSTPADRRPVAYRDGKVTFIDG